MDFLNRLSRPLEVLCLACATVMAFSGVDPAWAWAAACWCILKRMETKR